MNSLHIKEMTPRKSLLKQWLGILSLIFLPALLVACSEDKIEEQNIIDPDKFLISLNLSLPSSGSSSRAETKEDGSSSENTVEASDKEKIINNAVLYFYNGNEHLLTLYATKYEPLENNTQEAYTITAVATKEQMLYLLGQSLNLYVIANYDLISPNGVNPIENTFTVPDLVSPIGEYGEGGQILPMSNASKYEVDFTDIDGTTDDEKIEKLGKIISDDNTLNLSDETEKKDEESNLLFKGKGALDLERMVARIDFKNIKDNYTYTIGQSDINVSLAWMHIFNVNKESYLFRHASKGNNTAAGEALQLLEPEKGDEADSYNWITVPDFGLKKSKAEVSYLCPQSSIFTSEGKGYVSPASLCNEDKEQYHPWIYVTENTLPSTDFMKSKEDLNKYATGIAFKVRILGADGEPLTQNSENLPEGITRVDNSDDIIVTTTDKKWKRVEWENFGTSSTDEPFVDEGYFLTYYVHILHNNPIDAKNYTDGIPPMYFGVVRNNCYQLTVNSIESLPDPENPLGDDIKVHVRIKPWDYEPAIVTW